MLSRFLPNEYVKSIFDVHPETLKEQGIKGIITDLDNTLVAWNIADATSEVIDWFEKMASVGIKITILSNNNEARVKIFSDPINMPFISSARKPLTNAFKLAARQMELEKESIVVIGDQVMTDVLGGNSAGFYTILVVPIVQTDSPITKLNRIMERRVLNYMRKKGKINWEE